MADQPALGVLPVRFQEGLVRRGCCHAVIVRFEPVLCSSWIWAATSLPPASSAMREDSRRAGDTDQWALSATLGAEAESDVRTRRRLVSSGLTGQRFDARQGDRCSVRSPSLAPLMGEDVGVVDVAVDQDAGTAWSPDASPRPLKGRLLVRISEACSWRGWTKLKNQYAGVDRSAGSRRTVTVMGT